MNDTELSRYLSHVESKLKKLHDSIHPSSPDLSLVDQIQSILSQIKSSPRSWRKVVSYSHDICKNLSFRVPFSVVPQLVAKREVTIQYGQADVPYCYLHDVLEHCFKLILRHGLQKCKSMQGSLDKRCRILRHRLQIILWNNYKPYSDVSWATSSSLEQQEVMSESKFFPPCMSVLFQNLHENNRLQHHSRIQLTLFLKEIGLPVHEALQLWRHYYSKASDPRGGCHHKWEGNEWRYQYSIRHLYGLEGSRVNYRAHCCISLQEFVPPCGSSGGCPFKHFDNAKLIHFLSEEKIEDMEDIMDLRGQGQFSNACSLYLGKKTENILQSQMLAELRPVCEPSAKRARLETVTSDIKIPDKSSCVSPGESKEEQITTEKSSSSSCSGCELTSTLSTKCTENKRTEQSSADSMLKPFETNSEISFHGEAEDSRTIINECETETKHLPHVSFQNQRKMSISRKFESTLDVNSENKNNSEQNTTDNKETVLCYCHDLCLSQITNEEQLSKDQRKVKETKPIIKPSEFYVNFKNFCSNSRTAL
ncbi:DNA primase large subunit-like [Saccostrea cucullata]|uniref:DNA primase large subunit-like n=1 Tax=Saccostrea cuccullata TaxID=36930 RepID=UPI002ED334A4